MISMNRNERSLAVVCLLYVAASVVSFLLTIYVVAMWRLALPSYDLVDHHAFLAAAALGEMDWHGLWERHNGVHLIVLPKLIFLLDMYFAAGQGWLVTAVSALAVMATTTILLNKIRQVADFSAIERLAFSMLAVLMASSVLLAESLLNPIDIQWSLLALGTVLLGGALDNTNGWTAKKVFWLLSGFLVSWLSAGPLTLMLLSIAITLLLTRRDDRYNHIFSSPYTMLFILLLIAVVVVWEYLALIFNLPLLFFHAMRFFLDEADAVNLELYVRSNPEIYGSFFMGAIAFMGKFILVPLGYEWKWPILLILPLMVWVMLLWRSIRLWRTEQRFFVYLIIFSLLLGLVAGVARFFTSYNFRHANMGLLLLLSSSLLFYSTARWSGKFPALLIALSGYLFVFMQVTVEEAGAWSYEGRNVARYLQIGDALGIRDPGTFAPVWKDDAANSEAVEKSRTIFRQQRVGIYGSGAFRYFKGEESLPATEVACQHRLLSFIRHLPDPRAFALHAETRTVDGNYLTRALFVYDGTNVGWADAEMPSDKLWQQWSEPWVWGGHMVFEGALPAAVQVIVFDERQRCQPWLVPLSQVN